MKAVLDAPTEVTQKRLWSRLTGVNFKGKKSVMFVTLGTTVVLLKDSNVCQVNAE